MHRTMLVLSITFSLFFAGCSSHTPVPGFSVVSLGTARANAQNAPPSPGLGAPKGSVGADSLKIFIPSFECAHIEVWEVDIGPYYSGSGTYAVGDSMHAIEWNAYIDERHTAHFQFMGKLTDSQIQHVMGNSQLRWKVHQSEGIRIGNGCGTMTSFLSGESVFDTDMNDSGLLPPLITKDMKCIKIDEFLNELNSFPFFTLLVDEVQEVYPEGAQSK